jgi:hypothetical protein
MPVLNYHPEDKDLPDMSKPQKCDGCGYEQVGNQMYFAYYENKQIGVICRPCFLKVYGGPAPIHADQPCRCESPDIVEWLEVCQRCGGNIEAARAEMENIRIEIL